MPPPDFYFDSERFGSHDHALNKEYHQQGEHLRSLYPELKAWPNWATFNAWMKFGEVTKYCANPHLPKERNSKFIAFLYAEQVLKNNGYFVRKDGTRVTHYDLDSIDEYWDKYSNDPGIMFQNNTEFLIEFNSIFVNSIHTAIHHAVTEIEIDAFNQHYIVCLNGKVVVDFNLSSPTSTAFDQDKAPLPLERFAELIHRVESSLPIKLKHCTHLLKEASKSGLARKSSASKAAKTRRENELKAYNELRTFLSSPAAKEFFIAHGLFTCDGSKNPRKYKAFAAAVKEKFSVTMKDAERFYRNHLTCDNFKIQSMS